MSNFMKKLREEIKKRKKSKTADQDQGSDEKWDDVTKATIEKPKKDRDVADQNITEEPAKPVQHVEDSQDIFEASKDQIIESEPMKEDGAIFLSQSIDDTWRPPKLKNYKPGDVLLDQYKVEKVITSGGFGSVYIAYHRDWDTWLAIKAPNERTLADKDRLVGMVREAEAWNEMGMHPNIAYCYFVRKVEEVPHIFMEYLDGGSLTEWIKDGRTRDMKTALDMAIQFCHGMAFAHSKGYIHQDIKPDNVIFTQDGMLKVTDFGIAKQVRMNVSGEIVESDPFVQGLTPKYASPEQWQADLYNLENIGFESDIFSFGICLWVMLCGINPYNYEPFYARFPRDIPDPKDYYPDLPPALAELLPRLIAHKREIRQELDGFAGLKERFKEIFEDLYHEPSPHSELSKIDLTPDNLNNQGVSFMELGYEDDAVHCWQEAYEAGPTHPYVVFNHSTIQWRKGEITDDEVLSRLDACLINQPINRETVSDLKAIIHAARFDQESARKELGSYPGRFEALFSDQEIEEIKCLRTMHGHTDRVQSVCVGPDGRRAVSGSMDKTVRLWDLGTGECLQTMEGHTSIVTSVYVSPDGRRAVSGSYDKTLKVWDLETSQCLRTLKGHKDYVHSVGISPDGRKAVSGDQDGELRVWDLKTGECLQAFYGGTDFLMSVNLSPDGRMVVLGIEEKELQVYELETSKRLLTLKGHLGIVSSANFSPDGRLAVSGSYDNTLHVWDLKTSVCLRILKGHIDNVQSVSFSPDGRRVVSGSNDNTLRVWNLQTGACLRTMHGHTDIVLSVSFSPDGRRVVSGSSDNTLRVWALPKGRDTSIPFQLCRPKSFFEVREELDVLDQAMARSDVLFKAKDYKGSYQTLFRAWQLRNFDLTPKLINRYFRLTQKGQLKKILWHHQIKNLHGHTDNVLSVGFSPDGRRVVSGSSDKTLRVWDIETGACLQTLQGHARPVISVIVSLDGQRAVSGGWDRAVIAWDLQMGTRLQTMYGHIFPVICVCVSPDGRRAISGSGDKTLRVWDIETGACLQTLQGHNQVVRSVNVSLDGRRAISGSDDKTLRVWDIETGACLQTLQGHTYWVRSVRVCPDGRRVVSGSSDNTLRVWDIETGTCLKILKGHNKPVRSVNISPDGRRVVSRGMDGTFRVWDIEMGTCLQAVPDLPIISLSPDCQLGFSIIRDEIIIYQLIWDLEFD